MGKGGYISEYRERLDKTLASPELTNPQVLKTLVRDQLLRTSLDDETQGCSKNVLETRTNQVSHFLDMLRSASVTDDEVKKTTEASHVGWKLKEDNEEFRVMYRPGPPGTALHTLLVEGYVDAPVHTCLCVSWESALYPKWWPQYAFPPFKITISKCLQKIRIGEHISLLRFAHPEPKPFIKIADSEGIDEATHGFTKDNIPEAKDVVRIGVVGGFAVQKVTPERSYFRTIGNVDMKLDFVPTSLINFISRQLIGNGFRFYQKTVSSVCNHDKDYAKVLEDSMYARIREALYSTGKPNEMMEKKELESDGPCTPQELSSGVVGTVKNLGEVDQNVGGDENRIDESWPSSAPSLDKDCSCEVDGQTSPESRHEMRGAEEEAHNSEHATEEERQGDASDTGRKTFGEIEEDGGDDDSRSLEMNGDGIIQQPSANKIVKRNKSNIRISPDVEHALATLEKAISMVQEFGFNEPARCREEPHQKVEKDAVLQDPGAYSNTQVPTEISDKGRIPDRNNTSSRDIRRSGSNLLAREGNHNNSNRVMPASPEQYLSAATESNQVALSPSQTEQLKMAVTDLSPQDANKTSIHENSLHEGYKLSQQKKHRLCCFSSF
ncbi:hypothetical protein Tsubulata_015913 [Turnera subulata]|uniref:START domain-containing protein n=1 Tax=Turnera subulata TaxID=218843 RepID=A0A9Q0F7Y6_9ROSI|nr:hypothetical protein Tsubulata_015913 [Turnera subulata]